MADAKTPKKTAKRGSKASRALLRKGVVRDNIIPI